MLRTTEGFQSFHSDSLWTPDNYQLHFENLTQWRRPSITGLILEPYTVSSAGTTKFVTITNPGEMKVLEINRLLTHSGSYWRGCFLTVTSALQIVNTCTSDVNIFYWKYTDATNCTRIGCFWWCLYHKIRNTVRCSDVHAKPKIIHSFISVY